MPRNARLGDTGVGICCCHSGCIDMTGILIEGSGNVFTNGIQQSRLTDTVLGNCGHTAIMITSSSTVFTNGLGTSRITDQFSGSCFTGQIVEGSGNVSTGG
jgi:hypothetical protein